MNEYRDSMIDERLPLSWSTKRCMQFRDIFKFIYEQQPFFVHPEAETIEPEHWKTIAWNAAITAIDFEMAQRRVQEGALFAATIPGQLTEH